nr:hypothetical protein [Tanacetum cinerariifolium]
VYFLASKDETSLILKTFITVLENQFSLTVKVIRSDNETEFKNSDLNQFCGLKGIKWEFSVPRTPQQNRVAEKKNWTLIKAARTMLADSLLLIPFWAEAINTASFKGRLMKDFLLDTLCAVKHLGSAQSKDQDDKIKKEAKGKSHVEFVTGYRDLNAEFQDCSKNSSNEVPTASTTVLTVGQNTLNSTNTFSVADLSNTTEEPKRVHQALKDPSWIEAIQEELLQFKMQKVWVLVDLPYGKRAIAYASFMGFIVYQMDVKSAFLYGTIEEEVYVCQPLWFEDPNHPNKVYKVVKALYGLHQAPRAWGTHILLGSLGKSANTPIDTEKPLLKDPDGEDVDVHIYRSMIGSLMYLTSSRPDIMFAVCVCAHFQVTPKASHLHAVKQIFRYLKGKPHLGLWYPKDSPFDLVAYSDSDYVGQTATGNEISNPFTAVKQSTNITRLQALVDKKKVMISKAVIRDVLRLDDAEGVDCLPNEEIFTGLARMGYEKPSTKLTFYKAFFSSQWKFLIHTILQSLSAKCTSWNEFSSTMASAVICLSTGRKFSFSKYIFDSLVRNVDSSSKFYMYPRFIQLIIQNQLGDLSTYTTKCISPALTQKVFANMRRVGKGSSGVETPLFEEDVTAAVEEDIQAQTISSSSPPPQEDKDVDEIKQHLEIVPDKDDDVYTEATPLARKVPVVDYQIILLNNKPRYKIIKSDGTYQLYASFITVLKNFDRGELETLWSIVKERSLKKNTKCVNAAGEELSAVKHKLMLLHTAAERRVNTAN